MSSHDEEPSSTTDGSDMPSTRTEAGATSDFAGEDAEAPVEATAEEQVETARRQASENYERFVRAKADLDNLVKRHQRELSDRARYDGESLARDILQSIDDLERALEHAGQGAEGVVGGVELVLKGLVSALKRNGVERIEAEGKPFDPAEHEAVTMVESAGVPPNTVMSVFRAGYRMHDRLLRPAMVSVSKAPAGPAQNQGD